MNSITNNLAPDALEIGASLYFYQRTSNLRNLLKIHFPDLWSIIYPICLLRLIYDPKFKRLKLYYQCSILSEIFPYIDLSPAGIRSILLEIGRRHTKIQEFLQQNFTKNKTYLLLNKQISQHESANLFDFTTNLNQYAQIFRQKINLWYLFSLEHDTPTPVYYKRYNFTIPDVTAFENILADCNLDSKNIISVIDCDSTSKDDFNLLVKNDLQYILPLQIHNSFIKDSNQENNKSLLAEFDGDFIYNNNKIAFKRLENKNNFKIFLFYDQLEDEYKSEDENAAFISKSVNIEKQQILKDNNQNNNQIDHQNTLKFSTLSLQEASAFYKTTGIIILKTNCMNLTAQQIFSVYQSKQVIYDYCDTYDFGLDFNAPFLQDDYTTDANLFLNHLATMTYASCTHELNSLGLSDDVSFDDLRTILSKLNADYINGQWQIRSIPSEILKFCQKLKLDLADFLDLSALNRLIFNAKKSSK